MNKLKELSKKKWFIVLVIVLSIALVGGLGTYAMFYWRSTENTEVTLKIGDIADVFFPDGQELNTNSLAPVFNYTDGETLTFSIENKDTTGANISYTVNFNIANIDDELKNTSLRYKIVSGNTVVGQGDFKNASSNSTMKLAKGRLPSGITNYTLYLYIDSNVENDPNMMNRNISGVVEVTATESVGENLAEYITNLYLDNKDADPVINNDIPYGYASSVNLMNDRLGDASVDINGGNIRYFGSNPNNYIDINDIIFDGMKEVKNWETVYGDYAPFSTSSECIDYFNCKENWQNLYMESEAACNSALEEAIPQMGFESVEQLCAVEEKHIREVNLWRIIGVFGNKVRVVRNESIGKYSWDTSASDVNEGQGVNEWSQADLMKLLNPGYTNNKDSDSSGNEISVNNSLWWDKQSGTCYNDQIDATTQCDFTTSGLSNTAKDYIIDQTIYLGGYNTDEIYANQAYAIERSNDVFNSTKECFGQSNCNDNITRSLLWNGKVALPYRSDYGYATNFSSCKSSINYYSDTLCIQNNWMYSLGSFWTISPESSWPNAAIVVDGGGGSNQYPISANYFNIYPVLTLNPDVAKISGTGTEEDPFKIK